MTPMLGSNNLSAPSPCGDKALGVGVNVDESCAEAVRDLPLSSTFDCESLFLGASTALVYTLKVGSSKSEQSSVGLQDTRLWGALRCRGKDPSRDSYRTAA